MERYTFNPVSKTLVITAAFAKAMQDITSDEYDLYSLLMADIPDLEVVRKSHASPKKCVAKSTGEKFNCNQFKNLTYEHMEKFISALHENESYLREYTFIKNYASAVQTNGYTLVRRWFVAQFPEFRKNPLFYLYNQPTLVTAAEIAEQYADETVAAA